MKRRDWRVTKNRGYLDICMYCKLTILQKVKSNYKRELKLVYYNILMLVFHIYY